MGTFRRNALLTSTVATLREHQIEDPFYAGNKEDLEKKGLHFVHSHPDLRTDFTKALAGLPYRAFVIFGELKDESEYKKTYLSLLEKNSSKEAHVVRWRTFDF